MGKGVTLSLRFQTLHLSAIHPSFPRIWEREVLACLLLAALRQEAGAIAVTPVIRGIMRPQVVAVSVHCVTDPRIKGTPSRCCYNKPSQLYRSRHTSLHQ